MVNSKKSKSSGTSDSSQSQSSSTSSKSSKRQSTSSYYSDQAYHNEESDLSQTPRPTTEDPPLEGPQLIKPPIQRINREETFLKYAYDLKEEGNNLFKKKLYEKALSKYTRVQMYCRAVNMPQLPELQIAKTEEEIKKEKERRKDNGATDDPRDPRNDFASNLKSLEDINNATKWIEVPRLWSDLSKRMTQSSDTEIKVSKELSAQAFLNASMCFHNLGKYQKAILYCCKSHSTSPTIKAFFRQSLAHQAKKEYNMAMECIKEALKIAKVLVKEKECKELLKQLDILTKFDQQKEKTRIKKMKGFLK